jgi:hypothetical protein
MFSSVAQARQTPLNRHFLFDADRIIAKAKKYVDKTGGLLGFWHSFGYINIASYNRNGLVKKARWQMCYRASLFIGAA